VVIGGGDTGSDCIGTVEPPGRGFRDAVEIMPKPPEKENKLLTWPELAAQAAHLVGALGRLRARLGRADQARHRREW
jgi:NADPH-dependent glutamate synthase beta subunit-like oxidoreductase